MNNWFSIVFQTKLIFSLLLLKLLLFPIEEYILMKDCFELHIYFIFSLTVQKFLCACYISYWDRMDYWAREVVRKELQVHNLNKALLRRGHRWQPALLSNSGCTAKGQIEKGHQGPCLRRATSSSKFWRKIQARGLCWTLDHHSTCLRGKSEV